MLNDAVRSGRYSRQHEDTILTGVVSRNGNLSAVLQGIPNSRPKQCREPEGDLSIATAPLAHEGA